MVIDPSITLTEEVLYFYGTNYFVETGTYRGGAVELAIEAGFSDIRSVEIDLELFEHCRERFANDTRVTLYWGDSLDRLPEMICDIDEPITFWLDAHNGNSSTSGKMYAPILKELELISHHPVKDHVIIIDDVRLMGSTEWGVTKEDVIEAIHKINPRYVINYEDSRAAEKDIMIAIVPKEANDD